MFTRKKAATLVAVMCALPMFAAGAGQDGSRRVEFLDYSVQTATKRVYQLKLYGGGRSVWCKMEVTIDKHKHDPNDKRARDDLLDLTISYSDFGYAFPKPEEKTALYLDSKVREVRFDRFAYTAVIDKYGELVSSDLARQIAPLWKSAGEAEQTVMNMLLQPAISCTWLCVFPKLGPFEGRELVGRDIRDWTPLGVPDIEYALGHADTADKFHVEVREGNKMLVWSKTTRQTVCAEYFGTDNVSDVSITRKIEITFSKNLKAVEKASWKVTTSSERRPEDDTSGTFEAILQDE